MIPTFSLFGRTDYETDHRRRRKESVDSDDLDDTFSLFGRTGNETDRRRRKESVESDDHDDTMASNGIGKEALQNEEVHPIEATLISLHVHILSAKYPLLSMQSSNLP